MVDNVIPFAGRGTRKPPKPAEPGHTKADYIGLAERSAAVLIAECTPVTLDNLHHVVTMAWLRGAQAAYGWAAEALDRTADEIAPPTTDGA